MYLPLTEGLQLLRIKAYREQISMSVLIRIQSFTVRDSQPPILLWYTWAKPASTGFCSNSLDVFVSQILSQSIRQEHLLEPNQSFAIFPRGKADVIVPRGI